MDKHCLLDSHIEALGKELYAQKTELETAQSDFRVQTVKISSNLSMLKWIAESRLPDFQDIMDARIIGATLTKTYLSSVLRERTFDTVILDEASMAAIPALWCASYLAEKNIVLVGDFLQLPPIVMADTVWLKNGWAEIFLIIAGCKKLLIRKSHLLTVQN